MESQNLCRCGKGDALWTVKDVAAYLQTSTSWVYHRAAAGELPCIRVGRLLRFNPNEIKNIGAN